MSQIELFPIGQLPILPMTIPVLTTRHQRKPNSRCKRRRCKTVP
jgi:hypothetical protein